MQQHHGGLEPECFSASVDVGAVNLLADEHDCV